MNGDQSPVADTLAAELRMVLRAHPNGLTSHEALSECTLAQESAEISKALHKLRTQGEVVRDETTRRYRLADPAEQELARPARRVEREFKIKLRHGDTPADPADNLRKLLEENARNTQDAIDRYVWMVGDRRILESLMAQRDAARAALKALNHEP